MGDWGGVDEVDCVDFGGVDDCVDGFFVVVDDVEDVIG